MPVSSTVAFQVALWPSTIAFSAVIEYFVGPTRTSKRMSSVFSNWPSQTLSLSGPLPKSKTRCQLPPSMSSKRTVASAVKAPLMSG